MIVTHPAGILSPSDEGEGTFVTEQGTLQAPANNGAEGLGSLKLAQLKDLASQLGITGTSRMRKAQLVEVIAEHQRGGSTEPQDKSAKQQQQRDSKPAEQEEQKPAKQQSDKADSDKQSTEQPAQQKSDEEQDQQQSRGRRGARGKQQQRDEQKTREDKQSDNDSQQQQKSADKAQDADAESDEQSDNRGQRTRNQQRRDQDRQRRDQQESSDDQDSDDSADEKSEGGRRRRDDDQRNQRRQRQRDRNRSRDRRREQDGDDEHDQDVSEDETLVPISGILDVLDNYAFVRTSGYLPGQNDVYVSMAMVKRYGLRKGDAIRGRVRAPQADDDNPQNQQGGRGGRGGGRGGRGGRNRRGGGGNRQKFNALVKIDSLNGQEAVENPKRVEFNKLTPLYPQERLRLEHNSKDMGPRLVDLVAPIGKGQRGLIVSPPKAGKTMMLQSIANAITTNNPEVKLMMVLVDERPEEVTDMQRSVRGEVIASTFDRPAEDHTTVAELSIERAKRMVELGHDVVVLLDSMTRLGRAYNLATPASGRILSGGVDSAALYPPKKFFGAARNIEGGGSLTILATALVETGSRMDEVIFEEFKGTGNMELRLSRELSERRIFPAIDINASGTRREENLLTKEEIGIMWRLRRVLSGLETQQALELLTSKLKETETNAEFLMLVSKTTLRGQTES